MYLSDLSPGTDYDVVIESQARHQNQLDAWDPHDPYLCKEQGTVCTFRTGHPPMTPTEFSVIGGTTKSLKLAWNEAIMRGVKISKFLISVAGPALNADDLDLTSTQESVGSLVNTPRSGRKTKSRRHIIRSSNAVEIIPRVYEVPVDTVIYEVKNLVERTEYFISLHIVTPHSDADKVKQLYDSSVSVNTVENDIWTPYVTTTGITAGIDPPQDLHATKRETNRIYLEWQPAKAFGMYNLLHNIIRWHEVEGEEIECLSTREKLQSLRSKSSGAIRVGNEFSEAVVSNLFPGTSFNFQVEACFGIVNEGNDGIVSEIAVTNQVVTWTRAPPARPRLLLRSISQDEFELSWDKPVLLALGIIFSSKFLFNCTPDELGYYFLILT